MKKQKIQVALLLAVLILLAAAIPGIRYLNEKREAKTADAEKAEQDSHVVIDAAYEDVIKLSYDYEGETYTFEKEGDTWYAADDHSLDIQEYSIEGMLSGLTPFTAEQTIENVTDFSQYGLEQPQRTITFETANASHILYVGDHNTITGTYYICMPSESKVYVVEQTVVTRLNKTLEDVTEVSDSEEPEESEDETASAENASESLEESTGTEGSNEAAEDSGASSNEATEDSDASPNAAAEDSSESPNDTAGTESVEENPDETSEVEDSGER